MAENGPPSTSSETSNRSLGMSEFPFDTPRSGSLTPLTTGRERKTRKERHLSIPRKTDTGHGSSVARRDQNDTKLKRDWSSPGQSVRRYTTSTSTSTPPLTGAVPRQMPKEDFMDPFLTFPIRILPEERELTYYSLNLLSTGWWGSGATFDNEYLLPLAMHSAPAFQALVLSRGATHRAWLLGCTETPESMVHNTRAVALLRQHFADCPEDSSDETMLITLAHALVEDYSLDPSRKIVARIHMRAVRAMGRTRGGLAALENDRRLRCGVNWLSYDFQGYDSIESLRDIYPNFDLREEVETFIAFLGRVESTARRTIATGQCSWRRGTLAKEGSPFHRLLMFCPPEYRGQHYVARRRVIVRTILPLLVTSALVDYDDSPDLTERYLRELDDLIYANGLDIHPLRDPLIQCLLRGSEDPDLDDPKRPWIVGQMIKLMKRLTYILWERILNLLLDALQLQVGIEPLDMWADQVRREVFSAPDEAFVAPMLLESGPSEFIE